MLTKLMTLSNAEIAFIALSFVFFILYIIYIKSEKDLEKRKYDKRIANLKQFDEKVKSATTLDELTDIINEFDLTDLMNLNKKNIIVYKSEVFGYLSGKLNGFYNEQKNKK